ncbi:hypothetical protein [Streptomyces werraensis]|uniref:hypothetical protein n=1 Tax=Streptomyces werraensis TaxID=68284 RepID=UPI00341EBA0C
MATLHRTRDLFALSEIRGAVLRPGDNGYAEEVTAPAWTPEVHTDPLRFGHTP